MRGMPPGDHLSSRSLAYEEHEASEASGNYPYLIFRPLSVEANGDQGCVMLLFLHGVGACSNQPEGQSGNIVDRMVHAPSYRYTITGLLGNADKPDSESHLDDKYREVCSFLRKHFVVVAPQTDAYSSKTRAPFSSQSRWGQPGRMQKFINHVVSEDLQDLKITAKVVFGISMGGAGACNVALSGDFKAAVSVCGEGYDDLQYADQAGAVCVGSRNDQAMNFPVSRTALWAFHAKNDVSDQPSSGTEQVLREVCARLKALEMTGTSFPPDHVCYNWRAGMNSSWKYFDGVWEHEEKTLCVTQSADDMARVAEAGSRVAEDATLSSVELTSTGPPHALFGHFLWTVVTRDIDVFRWLLKKASEDPPGKAQPIQTTWADDNQCGVLPSNFPVVSKVDLPYDDHNIVCMGLDGSQSLPRLVLPAGSCGSVVSGRPGRPTMYRVDFRSGGGITLAEVPGDSLAGCLPSCP